MSKGRHVFNLVAAEDVGTLQRVLAPFAVAGVCGMRLETSPIGDGECAIRIETHGLDAKRASLIALRLANIASLRSIGGV